MADKIEIHGKAEIPVPAIIINCKVCGREIFKIKDRGTGQIKFTETERVVFVTADATTKEGFKIHLCTFENQL